MTDLEWLDWHITKLRYMNGQTFYPVTCVSRERRHVGILVRDKKQNRQRYIYGDSLKEAIAEARKMQHRKEIQ